MMMSLGYEVRTAGSHLPHFRQFQGLWSEKGGLLESRTQKEKSRSFFSLVSGRQRTPVLTLSLRLADFVTMHKLFHLLSQHQGLINHGKMSRNFATLNTNTGDPLVLWFTEL